MHGGVVNASYLAIDAYRTISVRYISILNGRFVMAHKTDGTFGNALGQVEPCDCGGVNLVIGPITLHFALDEVLALGELVDAARRIVQSDRSSVAQASGKRHPRGLLH
jgi:hypothetical protein